MLLYYFHLEPGNSFAGGGIYKPDAKTLRVLRDYIAENYKDLEKILNTSKFKKEFGKLREIEMLKTAPKGFDKDHPAINYLNHKNFLASKQIPDDLVISDRYAGEVYSVFENLYPFVEFLRKAV